MCGLIQDRRYLWSAYKDCVVGSELASFFLTFALASSREEAVALGDALIELGVLKHVLGRHTFKDKYLFYEFDDRAIAALRSSIRDILSDVETAARPSVLGAAVSARVRGDDKGLPAASIDVGRGALRRAGPSSGGARSRAASVLPEPSASSTRIAQVELLADLYVEQKVFVEAAKLYAYALSLRLSMAGDGAESNSSGELHAVQLGVMAQRRLLVRLFFVEFAYLQHMAGTMSSKDARDPSSRKRLKAFRARAFAAFESLTVSGKASSKRGVSKGKGKGKSDGDDDGSAAALSKCAEAVRAMARSREALRLSRLNAMIMLESGGSASDISIYCADTVISIFSDMVRGAVMELGPPPSAYALAVVGDLACRNVALYPRLDFAVVMEDDSDEASAYFHTLSTLVYLKVIGLGETQVQVFGTQRNEFGCSFGLFTPVHFPNEALGTPLKLASLFLTGSTFGGGSGPGGPGPGSPDARRSPLISPSPASPPASELSFSVPCIPPGAVDYSVFCRAFYPMRLVAGESNLLAQFRALVDTVLGCPLQDMSYSALRSAPLRPVTPVAARADDEMFVTGSVVRHVLATAMIREAVHAFDARRNAASGAVSVPYLHARPLVWDLLQGLIHGLAFYFEVDEVDSCWMAVEQLTSQGVLSPQLSGELMAALSFVYVLRLKLAQHYGCGRELATSPVLKRAHAQRVGNCECGGWSEASGCRLADAPLLSHSPVYELSASEAEALEHALRLGLALASELERLVSGVLPYSTPLLGHTLEPALEASSLGGQLMTAQGLEIMHAFSSAARVYDAVATEICDGVETLLPVEMAALQGWVAWRRGRAELAKLADGLAAPDTAVAHLSTALQWLADIERLSGDPAKDVALYGANAGAESSGGSAATWLVWSLMGLYSRPAIGYARALVLVHVGMAYGYGGWRGHQRAALKEALAVLTSLDQGSVSAAARTYSAVGLQRALVTVYGELGRVELCGKSLALASSYLTSALNRLRASSLRVSCPSPHAATGVEAYGMSFSEASAAAGLAPFVDAHLSLLFGTMSELMVARGDLSAGKDYVARGIEVQEHHLRRDAVPEVRLGEHPDLIQRQPALPQPGHTPRELLTTRRDRGDGLRVTR